MNLFNMAKVLSHRTKVGTFHQIWSHCTNKREEHAFSNFIWFWTNVQCCKWPNIEPINWPSGHTGPTRQKNRETESCSR